MLQTILTDTAISVSDLKKNPMSVIHEGDGYPVAVLNRNQPAFYCVPADAYEALMNKIEDLELTIEVYRNKDDERIEVNLDDL